MALAQKLSTGLSGSDASKQALVRLIEEVTASLNSSQKSGLGGLSEAFDGRAGSQRFTPQ